MWASSVAVDGSGNVYTTGYFTGTVGTVDFDPGPGVFNLTSTGRSDIFVSKLDSAGNFVWVRQMGGSAAGNDVAVDGSGNVYTTGSFSGTADFDPGAGVFNLTSAGGPVFVSKLDSAGNFVWVRQMGGTNSGSGNDVAVDGSGNVYTTGRFRGTADFDPGAGVFNLAAGGFDIFVSKLDRAGNFVWARHMGGTGDDTGYGVAVDDRGNVYTTGDFSGTADFDLTSTGASDIFVSKLDSAGNFVWARHMGGTTSFDRGLGVAVDGSGNVYTTGLFHLTADFDPGAGVFNLTPPSCGRPSATCTATPDMFVSKLDSAGNFVWARHMGGTGYDQGHGVAVDDRGNVYTTGVVDRFLGPFDIFVAKYNDQSNRAAAPITGILDGAGSLPKVAPGGTFQAFLPAGTVEMTATSITVPLSTNLGLSVLVDGQSAALFGVFPGDTFDQVNGVVPWGTKPGSQVPFSILQNGTLVKGTSPFLVQVDPASPGLYTFQFGIGPGIVQNLDDLSFTQAEGSLGTLSTRAASIGGVIIVWANGLGPISGTVPDGDVPGLESELLVPTKQVRLFIGGQEATILGTPVLHPALVALFQINAIVPEGIAPGDQVPIEIEVDCGDGQVFRSRSDVFIAVGPAQP